jgi:AcrR family transcriptional regulator
VRAEPSNGVARPPRSTALTGAAGTARAAGTPRVAGSTRAEGTTGAGAPRRAAGRGRTPRLTRQLIVEATATLLREGPGTVPTMARVATAVGASPMALYRHFRDRDDLLLAVARHVLSSQAAQLPDDATWEDQMRAWMRENYRQARAYPQLMQHALNGDATVWLGDAAVLVRILEHAGVREANLPAALSWAAITTLGHCLVASSAAPEVATARLYAALADLPPAEAARLAPVLFALPRTPEEAFEVAIEATITSVARFR